MRKLYSIKNGRLNVIKRCTEPKANEISVSARGVTDRARIELFALRLNSFS